MRCKYLHHIPYIRLLKSYTHLDHIILIIYVHHCYYYILPYINHRPVLPDVPSQVATGGLAAGALF